MLHLFPLFAYTIIAVVTSLPYLQPSPSLGHIFSKKKFFFFLLLHLTYSAFFLIFLGVFFVSIFLLSLSFVFPKTHSIAFSSTWKRKEHLPTPYEGEGSSTGLR